MLEPTIIPFHFPTCTSAAIASTIDMGFMTMTHLQAHMMLMSLFASIIGPFGGFFASGLKRAIKIKVFLLNYE